MRLRLPYQFTTGHLQAHLSVGEAGCSLQHYDETLVRIAAEHIQYVPASTENMASLRDFDEMNRRTRNLLKQRHNVMNALSYQEPRNRRFLSSTKKLRASRFLGSFFDPNRFLDNMKIHELVKFFFRYGVEVIFF